MLACGVKKLVVVLSVLLGAFFPLVTSTAANSAAVATRSLTLVIQTSDGTPGVGGCVRWFATDHSASASSWKVTDSDGRVTFAVVPVTLINVVVQDCKESGVHSTQRGIWFGVGAGTGLRLESGELQVPEDGDLVADVGPKRTVESQPISVVMPDGTPVGDATVTPGSGFQGQFFYSSGQRMWTSCQDADPTCGPLAFSLTPTYEVTTDAMGQTHMWRFNDLDPSLTPCPAVVRYDDGDLRQQVNVACDTPGGSVAVLPYMPVVHLGEDPPEVDYGTGVDVVATAVDEIGAPLAGQRLTLTPVGDGSSPRLTVTGQVSARAESCTVVKRGTTGADGRVRFHICPTRMGQWRADGESIVGSEPVTVNVRYTEPTAPTRMRVTYPSTRHAKIRWSAPRSTGGEAITAYQYKLGAAAWRSTGLTHGKPSRFVELSGLRRDTTYSIRVRAVNIIGVGRAARRSFRTPR